MKYFALVLFSLFAFNVFSQNAEIVQPDARLFTKYSVEYIETLKQNPNTIQYMNFELDFSYEIFQVPIEKAQQLPQLRYFNPSNKSVGAIVEDVNTANLNILLFDFERYYDKPSVYRIGNTGKIISFKSLKQLNKEFNHN